MNDSLWLYENDNADAEPLGRWPEGEKQRRLFCLPDASYLSRAETQRDAKRYNA